jgi:hypothetical protein
LADEPPHTPPEIVFGPEPEHGWCYYYQKADLARQRGDWAEVIRLGDQASAQGLAPGDRIEWMPFLQAYAQVGDIDRLTELAPIVKADPYTTREVCSTLRSTSTLSSFTLESIDSLYCIE